MRALVTAIALSACGAPAPPQAPTALDLPYVAVGPAVRETESSVRIGLVLTNPTDAPLELTGYAPDSFDPPLAGDQVAPLYRRQRWGGVSWSEDPAGFCGYGVTRIVVPARTSRRFGVSLEPGAPPTRVGVEYALDGRERVAWSPPLPRE